MRTRILMLLGLLVLALNTQAELGFKALSVTDVSQTYYFPTAKAGILICGFGTNAVYYRLFLDGETSAAATTAYAKLVAGTATAPSCIGFDKSPTQARYWRSLSIICAGGETATVHVITE